MHDVFVDIVFMLSVVLTDPLYIVCLFGIFATIVLFIIWYYNYVDSKEDSDL